MVFEAVETYDITAKRFQKLFLAIKRSKREI
jgi:hypothetical protein